MIALRLGVLLCAAIALVAFQPPLALGQAQVTKWSAQTTWSDTQTVDCLGEIHLTLTSHEVITERTDANGGYHWTYQFNVHNFTAYDNFGNLYSGSENMTESFHCGPVCEMPQEYSFVLTLTGQGHGSAPNVLWKVRSRVTINANGAPTASKEIDSTECRPKE